MEVIIIFYPESKIYSDGSHYIAIPPSSNPCKKRPKPMEELVTVVEEKEVDRTDVTEPQVGEDTADFDMQNDNTVSKDTETKQKRERNNYSIFLYDEGIKWCKIHLKLSGTGE